MPIPFAPCYLKRKTLPPKRLRQRQLILALLILSITSISQFLLANRSMAQPGSVTVFAAASLTNVLSETARRFENETDISIKLSFAGSSTLARQIEAGATADLFLSANEAWADYLLDRGLLNANEQFRRLSNKLILVAPAHSQFPPLSTLTKEAIARYLGPHGLVAMGDPDHVPAGIYGKKALQDAELWSMLRTRIARTDNVRGAVALASRGEVPLAITYRSDIVGNPALKTLFTFDNIDIGYVIAMVPLDVKKEAQQFYEYLISERGLALFHQFGFEVPPVK